MTREMTKTQDFFDPILMTILFTSIGRRGYLLDYFRAALPEGGRLLAASCLPDCLGAAAADEFFLLPAAADAAYSDALLELCKEESVDALFSLHDWENPDHCQLAK